jgi:hydrogenase maturation protease
VTIAAAGRVLVVGYGNPLCGDDGAGPAIAERMGADPRFLGADVRAQHQLTPELAGDIADASLVVLVDAADGLAPGEIAVTRVGPAGDANAWSHHIDPAGLAGLAYELWGEAPPVFTVCVGPTSMEVGDGLSPAVVAALPGAVDAVAAIVEAHGHA